MTRGGRSGRAAGEWVGLVGFVVATTAAIIWRDAGPGSPLRHLYTVPAVWSALRFGLGGGLGTAALAAFLEAPFLLEAIETWGLDAGAVEAIVTLGLVLLVGGLAGSLADRARRQRERYETVLSLQRTLGQPHPLAERLVEIDRALERFLRAERVEVVVRREDGWLGASGVRWLRAGTAGARAAVEARSFYLPDAPGAPVAGRPRRVLVVPLVSGGLVLGVAGAERAAGFSRDDRAAFETLGVQIALALENAGLKDELQQKIAAATRRLRELDRAKSELVSVASHELRTPLTSLRGFSELLLRRRYGEEEGRRFISVIHSEAERLGRILDNLLDLARIERGQELALRPIAVAVEPMLTAQVDAFGAQGARRRFSVQAAAGLPRLLVDPDALERILTNLVSNAVKYSPAESEIRLAATPAPRGRVEITVEDEGEGIPADALAHIFDRYYRVPGRDRAARGLGLGLALVKALVEASGGAIRVESALGAGSRFTVSLPAVS